jgi:hypothetical protein
MLQKYFYLGLNAHFITTFMKTGGDDNGKTARLALLLHKMLEEVDEMPLMEMATRTLGKLVKSGAARASDIVDKEVRGLHSKIDMHLTLY